MEKFLQKETDKPLISSKHLSSLKSFSKSAKLKKAALTYLASRSVDRDIQAEMAIFKKLDKNNDGYITLKELKSGMKGIPNLEEVSRILNSIDTDKNGAINYNEFIAATIDTEKLVNSKEDQCADAFQVFDKNGDGKITI